MTGLEPPKEGWNSEIRVTNSPEKEKTKKTKKIKVPNNIQDKGPALAEMVFAAGSIIGPILGGFLADHIGFKATADLIALTAVGFTVAYGTIAFCDCGSKRQIDIEKRNKLLS